MTENYFAERHEIVTACQMLAGTNCVRELVGHVSMRIGPNEMLVRCRRTEDPGVEFTAFEDIKRVDFDGISSELADGHKLQSEFAIHSEIYRRRPDVKAIVHGHPRFSLLCGLLDLPLRPIVGAYDPGMLATAIEGVPTYPRAILIHTRDLGQELAAALGNAPACLLQGHGIVTTGASVAEATIRAIKLESLAELTVQASTTGREPKLVAAADIDSIMASWEQAEPTYFRWVWAFYRRKLGLDDSSKG